jgi:hypothetical protein
MQLHSIGLGYGKADGFKVLKDKDGNFVLSGLGYGKMN